MTYRGVVFDFNGVLLWDRAVQVQSWQTVARELRGYEMTEEELSVHMHGRPNAYVLSYLTGRDIAGPELEHLIQVKESRYRELCLKNPDAFKLSPGAPELLDALVARNIAHTIATSSEKTNLDFFVAHLELARWFDITKIVYDDGTLPGKPAPEFYLAAAHNLGIPPRECVVVEDAFSGLQAARAAGIGYIIAIGAPAEHSKLASREGVAAVIPSLAEFPRERLATG